MRPTATRTNALRPKERFGVPIRDRPISAIILAYEHDAKQISDMQFFKNMHRKVKILRRP